jgi:hypothetical protein
MAKAKMSEAFCRTTSKITASPFQNRVIRGSCICDSLEVTLPLSNYCIYPNMTALTSTGSVKDNFYTAVIAIVPLRRLRTSSPQFS